MKAIRALALVLAAVLAAVALAACRQPDAPLDRWAQAARLGRGVNLGNALEAPVEGEWGIVIEEAFFPTIREAGFDTVRVPIRWSAHAQEEPPYTIDPEFFGRVDWVIDQATAQGLNVVINVHHYDALTADPAGQEERFLALWRQIAARYRDRPDSLYLEPLNEPQAELTAARWNALLPKVVTAIREVDGVHTIVVDAAEWATIASLPQLSLPPEEKNLICSFHFYTPHLFTHQGADWMPDEYQTVGVVWPGPPEQAVTPVPAVQYVEWAKTWFQGYSSTPTESNPAGPKPILDELDRAVEYGEQLDCPLWLGEFGSYSLADMDSRVRWTTFVREEAEKRGIPWAYWEFAAGFGIYDPDAERFREALTAALIPAQLSKTACQTTPCE